MPTAPLVDPNALNKNPAADQARSMSQAAPGGGVTPGAGATTAPPGWGDQFRLSDAMAGLQHNGTGTSRGAALNVELQGQGFGNERQNLTPTQAPQVQAAQLGTGLINPDRGQQLGAIDLVRGAANGTAPSQAVIAGQNAANRAAAQQFGLASAMQGRSPGAALNAAQNGSAQILGQNAADMTAARAGEMATARGQLVDATGQLRSADQGMATTNAGLSQQANLANQGATMQGFGLDDAMKQQLLNAQVASNGQYIQGIGNQQTTDAQKDASKLAFWGGLIGGGTGLAGTLLGGGGRGGGGSPVPV